MPISCRGPHGLPHAAPNSRQGDRGRLAKDTLVGPRHKGTFMAAAWGSTNPARTRRIKKSNNPLLQRRGSAFPSPASQLLMAKQRPAAHRGRNRRCPRDTVNCQSPQCSLLLSAPSALPCSSLAVSSTNLCSLYCNLFTLPLVVSHYCFDPRPSL